MRKVSKIKILGPVLHALALVLAMTIASAANAGEFRVGAAAVDITPKLCPGQTYKASGPSYDKSRGCFRWILLGGFGPFLPFSPNNRIAQGVHDPIWSRALVVQGSNGVMTLLIAADLPGLTWKHINPVKRKLALFLGIPFGNITIQALHTHSAPDAAGYWSTLIIGHNKDYTDKLRDWIFESGVKAFMKLEPARMKLATTTHYSCYDPKTKVLKKDPDCNLPYSEFAYNTPDHEFDEWLIERDMRDPVVRNTRIVAAQFINRAGKTVASLVNWHNHPELMESSNRLITSDYSHYLREYMETKLGGVSIYTIGTLGNQIGGLRGTPVPLWNENYEPVYEPGSFDTNGRPVRQFVRDGWEKIRSTGYEIAFEAVAALNAASPEENTEVHIRTESVENPVDNTLHVIMTSSVWNTNVEKPDRMIHDHGRCRGVLGCVRSEVSLLRIGELSLLTAPGEIDPVYFFGRVAGTVDYGEKWGQWYYPAMDGLEGLMPGKHKTMLGQANNYLSYLIPKSDFLGWNNFDHPNHYEDFVTIGKDFGDDTYDALLTLLRNENASLCQPSSAARSESPLITE